MNDAERVKLYRLNHPEKVKAYNATPARKAANNKRSRDYQKENSLRLEYKQVHNANANACRMGIDGRVTEEDWKELKASYGNRCVYCGMSGETAILTIDHLEPLSKSRNNTILNCVPACRFCNYAKNDKPLIIFLAWKNNCLA